MQYMGGKGRIANRVASVIRAYKGDTHTYLEPFLGAAFVASKVSADFGKSYASDTMPDLVMMWQALQSGWEPPQSLSKEEYAGLRHADPSALRAFAGFGCSFGGKWFGGYASNARGDDFCGAAYRGALKKIEGMRDLVITHADYRSHAPGPGWLVYCDPPYAGTTPYKGAPQWDDALFWKTMESWADAGATVLVSEYAAPPGWVSVWSESVNQSLRKDSNTSSAVEHIFMKGPTQVPLFDPPPGVDAPKVTPRKRAPKKAAVPATTPADPFTGAVAPRVPGKGTEPGEPEDVTRDGYGRYLIGPKGVKGKAYSRATTIAKTISDTYTLSMWGERMVAKGLMMRPDLRSLVAATPLEERDKLNALCEDAKSAAGSKVAANLGTAMHAHTEALDRGLVDEDYLAQLEELEKADLAAYARALEVEGIEILPAYIEKTVVIDEDGIQVAGTLDRIVRMPDGSLRIADLKTGRDLSYGWNEIAIQEHIYARARRIFNWRTRTFEPMPEGVDQDWALVFHLAIGSGECVVYDVDLRPARAALELCFQVRDWRKVRSIATVRSKAVAKTAVPVTPLDRVRAATTRSELSALWRELKPQGLWTTELAVAGQNQLSKFVTA